MEKKKKRIRRLLWYVAGSVVFLAIFWIALFAGTDDYKVKLPVIADVKPFAFVDQKGDTVTERDVLGKVCVVSFFFTTCPGICPRMNDNLKHWVYEPFKEEPDLLMLSHTSDPERDSVSRLKVYADSMGYDDPKHWIFLTGTKKALYAAARDSYHIDDESHAKQKIEDQFIHTQLIALIDKNGRLRGIYDGLTKEELEKLQRDIKALLKEPSGPRFSGGLFNNNPS
ncbi:SCO family protein [Dinghuibacter silviterrae]|uniref:Protein SCO1/2 n=1 Tax=Dinghuibacter silviterrae TaxID=1539049 RepID=A0A4R8DNL1_9BACT|nr:SCO family protein [Dinghuibacter silviterrae]TDW99621.1 protein SCO1/2 [Dinghuibacter silviterrae]